jgi:Tfp pilus assembly protein PilX
MKRRGRNDGERGFTMIIVVMVLALILIIGSVVLGVLTTEQKMVGLSRISMDSVNAAEGGFMEVLDDNTLTSALPDFQTPSMSFSYTPSAQSVFNVAASATQPKESYTATVRLVRTAPLQESGINLVRAFIYEVQVESNINSGQQTSEVDGEIFRVFSLPVGTVLPAMYAR